MNPSTPIFSKLVRIFSLGFFVLTSIVLSSCGGSGSGGGGTTPPGPTQVVVLVTSTANDQLVNFSIGLASIVLTDSKGNTTTIFTTSQFYGAGVEWMHLNGTAEPFLTASIPTGSYTAATITTTGCWFTNVTFSGNLTTSTYDEGVCAEGTNTTTVTLPSPIAISGTAMALSLSLQVGSSWTLEPTQPIATYTIDPTFTLTPVTINAAPTNETNGLIRGVNAQVTALSTTPANATITLSDQQTFTVTPSATAVYQGVANFSGLTANEIVNMDLAIQPDGSLTATRVEVDDAASIYADIGTYVAPDSPLGTSTTLTAEPLGCPDFATQPECTALFAWGPNSAFGVSAEFSNLAIVPLQSTFDSTLLTPGQVTSAAINGPAGNQNLPYAEVVTLEPQTLDGNVESVTNENGVAVYTVVLSPYDIFSITQQNTNSVQPVVPNPNTVLVYADSNTQFLHTQMIEEGDVLRFHGVVINDNGTLRMDCNTVLDGVTQ